LFSAALAELEKVRSIKDPVKKINMLRTLAPRLHEIAIEDEEFSIQIDRLTSLVDESIEICDLITHKKRIESLIREIIREIEIVKLPSSATEHFINCFERLSEVLMERQRFLQPSLEKISFALDGLHRKLIGRRLEKEIVPNLLKQMGYELGPRIYSHQGVEIEIDAFGQKIKTNYAEGQGKILKKEIVIVECKTTIDKKEIVDFLKKVEIIANKYRSVAQILEYKLKIESWIVACYGWTDELKRFSKEKGLEPLDSSSLEGLLKKYGIIDRRYPVCP